MALLSISVLAADEQELTLDRSIDLALQASTSLQTAANAVDAATRTVDQNWGELLPSLTATVAGTRTQDLFVDPDDPSTTLAAGLTASLSLQAGLAATFAQTRLALSSAEISYEDARRTVVNSVEQQFRYLLAYKGSVEIAELDLQMARERYESVEAQYERGLASELDVLEANVTVATQEPEVLSAQNTYDKLLRNFASLLGLDPGSELTLDGTLEVERIELDGTALADEWVWQRLDVIAAQNTISTLEQSLRETRGDGLYPTLTLSGSWEGSVLNPQDDWDAGADDSLAIKLGLSIPLDSWIAASDTGKAISAVEDDIADAQLTLQQTVEDGRIEILDAVAELDTLWSQIEMSEASIEQTQRAYEMTEEAYQRGTRSLLDVNDAQQSYLSARQTAILNQYNYHAALIDLREALGVESLSEIRD